jgi:hypothetical protein
MPVLLCSTSSPSSATSSDLRKAPANPTNRSARSRISLVEWPDHCRSRSGSREVRENTLFRQLRPRHHRPTRRHAATRAMSPQRLR